MWDIFCTFVVEIRNTFSPPETRQSASNMMIIELSTQTREVDIQMQAIKAIEAISNDYVTPIKVSGNWDNQIIIRSEMMIPSIGTEYLKQLCEVLSTDGNAVHYYINELIFKREKK